QEDAWRFLLGRDTLAADFLWQLGLGNRYPVLHQNLGHVQVGPQFKGDVQVHLTVIGAKRGHVKHVLDAVNLLFNWRGDGVRYHLSVGSWVYRGYLDSGRHHFWVLGDRQLEEQENSQNNDTDRHHGSADRSIDEEA